MASFSSNSGQNSLSAPPMHESFGEPLPSSQASSLNSSNSQVLQLRPTSSEGLNLDPSTQTPSTSLSNKSSQEHGSQGMPDASGAYKSPALELQTGLQLAPSENMGPAESYDYHTSAPKRMVNGDIKSSRHSQVTSPISHGHYGHSRNSSMASRDSHISDLSSQLKTRLSYAMMKVQHGWQSHNIDQLEQLTSNQNSPISASSEQRRPNGYSPSHVAPTDNFRPLPSSIRSSGMVAHRGQNSPTAAFDEQKASSESQQPPQIGAAYESFWREHESTNSTDVYGTQYSSTAAPSLEPPVDILPRNVRQGQGTTRQPPALRTNISQNSTTHLAPKTPSPRKPTKIRTPSQQAAVEKDAVESLLFMSSPGNSGYYPATTTPGTLLRSDVGQPATKSFASPSPIYGQGTTQHEATFPSSAQRETVATVPRSNVEIDKMLDEMGDSSSSDEENLQSPVVLRNETPR